MKGDKADTVTNKKGDTVTNKKGDQGRQALTVACLYRNHLEDKKRNAGKGKRADASSAGTETGKRK